MVTRKSLLFDFIISPHIRKAIFTEQIKIRNKETINTNKCPKINCKFEAPLKTLLKRAMLKM